MTHRARTSCTPWRREGSRRSRGHVRDWPVERGLLHEWRTRLGGRAGEEGVEARAIETPRRPFAAAIRVPKPESLISHDDLHATDRDRGPLPTWPECPASAARPRSAGWRTRRTSLCAGVVAPRPAGPRARREPGAWPAPNRPAPRQRSGPRSFAEGSSVHGDYARQERRRSANPAQARCGSELVELVERVRTAGGQDTVVAV